MSVGELKNTWRSRFGVSCTAVKSEFADQNYIYEVEAIVARRRHKHDYIYRDRWKEYGEQGLVFYVRYDTLCL